MSDYKSLNTVVHAPIRLGILTILSQLDSCNFTYLRGSLEVSDGNLSTHLSKLEEVKYLKVTKSFINKNNY